VPLLERPARELKGPRWQQATGTSGTILAIGTSLRLRALSGDDRQVEGARPAGDEIENRESSLDSILGQRQRISPNDGPCPASVHNDHRSLLAEEQILEGAMRALGIDTLRTCSWALREEFLIDRLRRDRS